MVLGPSSGTHIILAKVTLLKSHMNFAVPFGYCGSMPCCVMLCCEECPATSIAGHSSQHNITQHGMLPQYPTYLLTPWCRVALEQLTGLQLVKKFPAFHGTRRFITALTSVRQLSISWASPNQSIYPHPTSWRSILILSTHLRLGLPSGPQYPTGTAKLM